MSLVIIGGDRVFIVYWTLGGVRLATVGPEPLKFIDTCFYLTIGGEWYWQRLGSGRDPELLEDGWRRDALNQAVQEPMAVER